MPLSLPTSPDPPPPPAPPPALPAVPPFDAAPVPLLPAVAPFPPVLTDASAPPLWSPSKSSRNAHEASTGPPTSGSTQTARIDSQLTGAHQLRQPLRAARKRAVGTPICYCLA